MRLRPFAENGHVHCSYWRIVSSCTTARASWNSQPNSACRGCMRTWNWLEAGGLMSYGPSYADMHRRAATFVDKILKGRNPSDLPVEQPMKFELVINLKAAKHLGLTIPQSMLYRADKVIK